MVGVRVDRPLGITGVPAGGVNGMFPLGVVVTCPGTLVVSGVVAGGVDGLIVLIATVVGVGEVLDASVGCGEPRSMSMLTTMEGRVESLRIDGVTNTDEAVGPAVVGVVVTTVVGVVGVVGVVTIVVEGATVAVVVRVVEIGVLTVDAGVVV